MCGRSKSGRSGTGVGVLEERSGRMPVLEGGHLVDSELVEPNRNITESSKIICGPYRQYGYPKVGSLGIRCEERATYS
jgi:hypothetical protein